MYEHQLTHCFDYIKICKIIRIFMYTIYQWLIDIHKKSTLYWAGFCYRFWGEAGHMHRTTFSSFYNPRPFQWVCNSPPATLPWAVRPYMHPIITTSRHMNSPTKGSWGTLLSGVQNPDFALRPACAASPFLTLFGRGRAGGFSITSAYSLYRLVISWSIMRIFMKSADPSTKIQICTCGGQPHSIGGFGIPIGGMSNVRDVRGMVDATQ